MSIRTKLLIAFFTTSSGLLCLLSGILLFETHTRFGIVCAMVEKADPALSTDVMHHFDSALTQSLIITLLMFIAASISVAIFMSRLFSTRILSMQRHARELANGNWETTIPVTGKDELSSLEDTLNHLARELSNQEALRKSLMQDIAHELRTPLTTMKSHMEAFLDGIWEPSPRRFMSCLEELDRLQHLVNQVEELYAAESCVSRSPERIDLQDIVLSIAQLFHSRCQAEGKTLRVHHAKTSVLMDGNRHDITEIVWNLVDNAVKYTTAGGNITIETGQDDTSSWLYVRDTGIGIPAADLPYVFQRFYRVEKSRNRSTGGSGLGLAIVHRLTMLSGGTIQVESQPDQGSTFSIRWPISATNGDATESRTPSSIRAEFA